MKATEKKRIDTGRGRRIISLAEELMKKCIHKESSGKRKGGSFLAVSKIREVIQLCSLLTSSA